MSTISIRLFGAFAVKNAIGGDIAISGRRTQALAIYLALEIAGEPTLREAARLIFSSDETDGRLAETVRDLRLAFIRHPDAIIETPEGIAFNRKVVEVDAQRFDELVEAKSLGGLRVAADLYVGNLAESFKVSNPEFDDWLAQKRLAYWRSGVGVLGRLLATLITAGWWENAIETAGRLLAFEPTAEVVHRTLMRLHLEQGRPDSALRRYQDCADILRREFGCDPSGETQRVRDEIVKALERTPAPRQVLRKSSDGPTLVLVVEDDAVSAALIEGFLSGTGYETITVADGADALMEIARRTFDLVIVDINIPTLNGLRLFEIMVQKGIETPAIFVTGIPGPEVEARSLELGAADFLRKPIRKEVLLPRVRAALERKRRPRAEAE